MVINFPDRSVSMVTSRLIVQSVYDNQIPDRSVTIMIISFLKTAVQKTVET